MSIGIAEVDRMVQNRQCAHERCSLRLVDHIDPAVDHAFIPAQRREESPMRAAEGIVNGLMISLTLWGAVVVILAIKYAKWTWVLETLMPRMQ